MKTLANCKPTEFVSQTTKIKDALETWLTATDVLNIRKRLPDLIDIDDDMDEDKKRKALLKNLDKRQEQRRQNLSDIFDAVFAEHPKETLELLALMCFVDPEHVDDHPVTEYLGAVYETLTDENVLRFFSLFRRLGASAT